ncbi:MULTISPECIES: DUF202 domain-containing protein [Nguyenibacter]|uniref:DUF202 domain-containing protein n=1 Tax=Nguyenibacter vanlangensis TaxID=1216886 RepID=A0ABZ3D172_9PROT|nr:DUF202 domain-containing protein [Nguyenibacter sp. L1]WRH86689.1 DUF202 domain-containing protein [Nguyenibacter sp. L1]
MISRYTGHAANERTFLAWMRTALAILAFGGVLTKFDLFLRLVAACRRFRVTRDAISAEAELRSAGPAMERALTIVLTALGCAVLAALVRAIVS